MKCVYYSVVTFFNSNFRRTSTRCCHRRPDFWIPTRGQNKKLFVVENIEDTSPEDEKKMVHKYSSFSSIKKYFQKIPKKMFNIGRKPTDRKTVKEIESEIDR